MRRARIPFLVLVLALGVAGKLGRLSPAERDHYAALRVWMDADQKKAFLKLKTEEQRNDWLRQQGLWDRFYRYDEATRTRILEGDVARGWKEDQVFMAWGEPHERRRLTGRPAARSELLAYRFEVDKDGYVMVWKPKSKTAHRAAALYVMEVFVDDGVVTDMVKKNGW